MKTFFVFDVESVGLHGEGFAVGGGVYLENGSPQSEFCFSCPAIQCEGNKTDLEWVNENVPVLEITHRCPRTMRDAFWELWMKAKLGGALMAADCSWPVEAGFLARCVYQDMPSRSFAGPYPMIDVSSVLFAAGMDPVGTYDRTPSELPKHNPLNDARQSARILAEALSKISTKA